MQQVADRIAIHELLARYADAFDEGRIDEMIALFTPDGRFEVHGEVIGLPPLIEGQEALHSFMTRRAKSAERHNRTVRHIATNIVVTDLSDTTARTTSYLLLLWNTGGELTFPLSGRYVDDLVKIDGNWRFLRRTLRPDGVRAS